MTRIAAPAPALPDFHSTQAEITAELLPLIAHQLVAPWVIASRVTPVEAFGARRCTMRSPHALKNSGSFAYSPAWMRSSSPRTESRSAVSRPAPKWRRRYGIRQHYRMSPWAGTVEVYSARQRKFT